MNTATKWGLGLGVVAATLILYATRSKAATNVTPPSPSPPGPQPANLGALAQTGDVVEVPVSLLYPRGVPFDATRYGIQPNERIDTVSIQITNEYPNALEGVTVGFAWSGPSRSSSTGIPERIPTPAFSRGGVQGLLRNGQRIG